MLTGREGEVEVELDNELERDSVLHRKLVNELKQLHGRKKRERPHRLETVWTL
jgi:hypothetical protein